MLVAPLGAALRLSEGGLGLYQLPNRMRGSDSAKSFFANPMTSRARYLLAIMVAKAKNLNSGHRVSFIHEVFRGAKHELDRLCN